MVNGEISGGNVGWYEYERPRTYEDTNSCLQRRSDVHFGEIELHFSSTSPNQNTPHGSRRNLRGPLPFQNHKRHANAKVNR